MAILAAVFATPVVIAASFTLLSFWHDLPVAPKWAALAAACGAGSAFAYWMVARRR